MSVYRHLRFRLSSYIQQNPSGFSPLPFIAQRENRVGASLNRLAYAIRDVVHVDLSGGFDVFMAQDSLSVLHSAVLLEVSAQCATEDLECSELPGNVESIRDA